MSEIPEARELTSRTPALRHLGHGQQRGIPFIPQLNVVECGVACVAMVLAYHGKHVAREEIRAVIGATRDGTRASALLATARRFGLRGRGVKLELNGLRFLRPGAILHWAFNHFVLFERVSRDGVVIVDPAIGRRTVTWQETERSFTGVAIDLEPDDDFEPSAKRSRLRAVLQLLWKSGEWPRILVLSAFMQVLTLALPLLVGLVVDRVIPRGDERLLLVVALGLGVMLIFHAFSTVVRGHAILALRTRFDATLTTALLERMLQLPYAFFQQRPVGDLFARLNSNTTIREILTSSALSTVLDGTMMCVYLAMLLIISAKLGAIVLALCVLEVAIVAMTRGRLKDLQAEGLERRIRCEDFQFEMLGGIETLKAMGAEPRVQQRWGDLFVDVLNNGLHTGRLAILFDSITAVLRMGAPLVIFTIGALAVLRGELSVGAMLAIQTFAVGVFGPLSTLVATVMQLDRLGIYFDRVVDVFDAPTEQRPGTALLAAKLSGAIEVEDLRFRHGPADPEVIRGVWLKIAAGEFVAIVGRSGSGKSTLAALLVGLYRATSGRISYDGASLNELDLLSVRQQLGIVTQNAQLFSSTIRANIALADPQLPFESIVKAAQTAQLHDEITQMPMSYDTLLSSGGGSISGGQRQRLAIARAIVRRPAILVLDEATSALDAMNEQRVQEALAPLRCTRIVIAHRLSTIINADRILVMERGRVVEQGTHRELLEAGGVYAALVAAQSRHA
jgi:ATP-binding cassette subfamily B protein